MKFQVQDTAGVTFTRTYTPKVSAATTSQPVVCRNPQIASTRVIDQRVRLDYYDYYGPAGVRTIKLRNVSMGDALPLYASPDRSKQLAMANARLWYSGNGGTSWQDRTPAGLDVFSLDNVVVSEDGSHIVVFTYDVDESSGRMYGYRSENSGTTWNKVYLPSGVESTRGYAMSPDGSQLVFMGAKEVGEDEYAYSTYVSTDNGASWNERFAFTTEDSIQGMSMYAGGQIIVVDNAYGDSYESQTLVSYDRGVTFELFSIPLAAGYGGYYNFQASADGQTRIVQLGYYDGVAVSTNGGADWEMLNTPPMFSLTRIFMAPINGTIILYGSDLDYQAFTSITKDAGATWQDFSTPDNDTSFPQEVRFYSMADTYLVGVQNWDTYENKWYTTTNGSQEWNQLPLIVNQDFDPALIDLDPQTSGNQYAINREAERGWKAVYDVSADELTVTITDMDKFYDRNDENAARYTEFQYTLTSAGCTSPAPGYILAILDFGG